jgi:phosphotransferase system  glucose/maltose/N-acetylglucosamine-specific IIC component
VFLGFSAYVLVQHDLLDYEPIIYVFTGVAGLLFTTALVRSGLAPAWLTRLGVVGYVAILAALPIELFTTASLESLPGMLLYVPGGLFEFVLPILLITRGFRQADTSGGRDATTLEPPLAAGTVTQ